LKNMLVKMGIFPNFWNENIKVFELSPPSLVEKLIKPNTRRNPQKIYMPLHIPQLFDVLQLAIF